MSITEGAVAESPADASDTSSPDSNPESFTVGKIADCFDFTWKNNVTWQKMI